MSEDGVGQNIKVHFDGKRCIHARKCVTGLPQVFRGGVEGNWIYPDSASQDELLAVVRSCPSGALTYERRDGGAAEQAPSHNVMQLQENGPLAVRADVTVGGSDVGHRMTLCRCGASKNKPYCDNTHLRAKFQATAEVATVAAVGDYGTHGPLAVTPLKDGPLLVKGAVEICAASGRTITKGQELFLCRCGRSDNKPFCDGSHRAARFSADGA
jgi:CDGSH-type Zn-finger protein/uncharacterized Fe-S cluster protein YjdI